jgi:hypothetical protein
MLFADSTNIITNLWTITATPANPIWGTTTSTFVSPPNSYTDSPIGNYTNNATVTMTTTNSINLSSYQNPKLTFMTRWDIENNWDYGQVEFSTNNGLNWIPLAGTYTNPGTGTFQPNGEPVYDGIQSNWVLEEIQLTGYNSAHNKIRFELRTDNSIQRDGWYIDNIGIYVYTIIPVELLYFNAKIINSKIQLNWSTANELNNLGFEIQRKTAGSDMGWENIGFVNGAGTSNERIYYSFFDDNPIVGTLLYRLKQIDIDGSYKVFPTVSVDYNIPTEFALQQNYPNPLYLTESSSATHIGTTINWQMKKSGFVSIKLFNVLGKEVDVIANGYFEEGRHFKVYTPDKTLPSGIYFYQMQTEGFTDIKKMMMIR